MNKCQPRFDQISYRIESIENNRRRNTTFGKENFTRNQKSKSSPFTDNRLLDSPKNGLSYIGSTVHFVMGDELNRRVLFLKELKPPHTSQNIQTLVEDYLENYKIKPLIRLDDFQLLEDVPEIQSASCRKLLENYIKTPKLFEKIDAVKFWTNYSEFKDVLDIILEILACPASSSSVERLFSLCGLRTCNRRNRTLPETLEKLVKIAF